MEAHLGGSPPGAHCSPWHCRQAPPLPLAPPHSTHPSSRPCSRSPIRVPSGGASCPAGRPAVSAPSRPRSRPARTPRCQPHASPAARAGPAPHYTLRGEKSDPACLSVLFVFPGAFWFGHSARQAPAHVLWGAHPARPRGPRSRVPGQRPQNLRPSHLAATSPGSQEGTLGTGPPPTEGPAPPGPAAWHTLEIRKEAEDLNSLLTPTWVPLDQGLLLSLHPSPSYTFEAPGGVGCQTQGQVQANARGAAGDEHDRAVHEATSGERPGSAGLRSPS